MSNSMAAIIGTLAGVLVGGFITFGITFFQLYRQEKQKQKEIKIKAYENIHKQLSAIDHEAEILFHKIVGSGIFQVSEIQNIVEKISFEELEMLISFYAPNLIEDFKLIEITSQHLGDIASGTTSSNSTPSFGQTIDTLKTQIIDTKNKILELAERTKT